MGELQDEINEMIDVEDPTMLSGTQAPSTDAPGTQAPGTEAPGTQAPATDAPATDAPTTEAPSSGDDLERIRKERDELREKLAEREAKPKTSAPKTSAPTTDAPLEDQDFIGDEDFEDLTDNPDKLNSVLNKVFRKGVQAAVDRFAKQGTPNITGEVQKNLNVLLALKEANEEFYEANKDLQPFKKVVATVYGEVVDEHPDWTMKEALDYTGKETRKRLELTEPKTPPGKKKTPGAKLPPGTKGGRHSKQKPSQSGLLDEIDEMNKPLD